MICKSCNREIPDDSKFCTFCGAVTENSEAQTATAAGFTSSAPSSEWQSSGAPAPGAPVQAPGAPASGMPVQTQDQVQMQPQQQVQQQVQVQPQVQAQPQFQPQPQAQQPAAYSAPVAQQPPMQQPAATGYAPAPAPSPIPATPVPGQAQQSYGGYQQAGQAQPQVQPQPQAYSSYGAPVTQIETKKKSPLPFFLIGAGVVVVLVIAIIVLSGPKKWTGGTNSSQLPSGYMAIVDNEYVTIGIGEVSYYEFDNTVYAKFYVINRSDYAIYCAFGDNYLDGSYTNSNDIWTQIYRTEPNSTSGGMQGDVVWFDSIHDVDDLNNWRGTIYIIDDDTWDDPDGPEILDSYDFDITYK